MNCPYCRCSETKVIDKRDTDPSSTRRRRECLECNKRFTTYERIELVEMLVVKKDGSRESFNPEKIRSGISRACEKRPISRAEIDAVVQEIELNIRSQKESEITSSAIGELIMQRLKDLDEVAYIRFASVYRSFADIESFQKEVKNFLRTTKH